LKKVFPEYRDHILPLNRWTPESYIITVHGGLFFVIVDVQGHGFSSRVRICLIYSNGIQNWMILIFLLRI
jgi:hypothetical protein